MYLPRVLCLAIVQMPVCHFAGQGPEIDCRKGSSFGYDVDVFTLPQDIAAAVNRVIPTARVSGEFTPCLRVFCYLLWRLAAQNAGFTLHIDFAQDSVWSSIKQVCTGLPVVLL